MRHLGLLLQESGEEVICGIERLQPPLEDKKIVHLIRENYQLVMHIARPQQVDEADGLPELDVAVVVALDQ